MDKEINNYIIINNLTHINKEDKAAVIRLLKTQDNMCPGILDELIQHGEKISCWAWYIFPTKLKGKSDTEETYVTIDTAQILLEFAPYEWCLCLEKIIKLAIDKKYKLNQVLPSIDIDRVNFFVDFWKNIPNKPEWLTNVCDDLDKILKGMAPIQRIRPNENTRYLLLLIQKHFNKLDSIKNI
jgi:hypothetical protein